MEKDIKTDSLNIQEISFSQFVRTLYSISAVDCSDTDFMIDLIRHSLRDGAQNPLPAGDDGLRAVNYRRFLREEDGASYRQFPRNIAAYILRNFDKQRLVSYIDEILEMGDGDIAEQSLCDALFYSDHDVTCLNVSEYAASLFMQILHGIVIKKRRRVSRKTQGQKSAPDDFSRIEDRIRTVLDEIFSAQEKTDLRKFRMMPVSVKKKIAGNVPLEDKITGYVIKYYRFVKDIIAAKQEERDSDFDYLASAVCGYYNDIKEGRSQEEIFDSLADYFLQLSHRKGGRAACEILAAFFVQNCEVFDAVA